MALPLLDEGEDVTAMFSIPSAEDGDDVTAMFSVPSVNEGKDVNKMFSVPSAEDGEDVTSQFNASAAPTSNVIANMGRSFLGGVAGGVADIVGGAAGILAGPGRSDAEDIAEFETKSAALSAKPSIFKDFTEEQIIGMQAAPEGYRTPQEEVQLASYDSTLKTLRERQAKNAPIQQGLEDFQKLSSEASKEAQTFFGQDPARQDEFLSKLAAGAGSLPPYIASSIAGGPVLSMMTGALQTGQNEYNAAIEAGRPDLADEAMVKGMGIGLTEGAGVGGGLGKAAQGFAAKALVTLKKGFEEGGQEWVQNTLSNLNASTFTGYDPARPALKGSGEAFAIGAILGGGVEGATQPFRSDKTTTPSVAPETAAAVARTQPVTVTVPEVAPPNLPSGSLGPPDPIVVEAEAVGATQTAAALNQTMPPKPFAPTIEEPGTPTPYGRETDVFDVTAGLERKPSSPAPSGTPTPEQPPSVAGALLPEQTRESVRKHTFDVAKAEIEADIKSGDIPDTVKSFEELQDYSDANMYVNDAERADRRIGPLGKKLGWKPQDYADFTEDVIGDINSWLQQRSEKTEPTRTEPSPVATPAAAVPPAPAPATPSPATPATQAPAAQAAAPVARAMTRSEINERIAVLLKAPVKAGGKPRVSFKTQAEEASFRRGFEAANKKPGEPPPEQRPGVPAKEQKIYDAFSQGWSQAQTTIRSLNQPTPAPAPVALAPVAPVVPVAPAVATAPATQAPAAQAARAKGKQMVRGDRFKDANGNEFEVWKNRQGTVEAHPVVNGKPVVNRDSGVRFSVTDEAKARNPQDRTDLAPTPAAETGAKGKQPWEMTNAEYNSARFNFGFQTENLPETARLLREEGEQAKAELNNVFGQNARRERDAFLGPLRAAAEAELDKAFGQGMGKRLTQSHEQQVAQALREGKPVPPEVLADYPDLAPTPAPSPAPAAPAAPAPARIQLKSGPATYSVVEQLPPQKGDQPGEVYFRVKNERTGEEQTVEAADMKPVKVKGGKVAAEPSVPIKASSPQVKATVEKVATKLKAAGKAKPSNAKAIKADLVTQLESLLAKAVGKESSEAKRIRQEIDEAIERKSTKRFIETLQAQLANEVFTKERVIIRSPKAGTFAITAQNDAVSLQEILDRINGMEVDPKPYPQPRGQSAGGSTETKLQAEQLVDLIGTDEAIAEMVRQKTQVKGVAAQKMFNDTIAEIQKLPKAEGKAAGMKRKLRGTESGAIPASLFADIADFGARLYRDGMGFAAWAKQMVRHLSERVRSALKELWVGIISPKGARNLRGEVIQKRDEGGAIGAAGGRAEPKPGSPVEGGREGEYYTRVAERDKGTLSDNAMKVVRNRTTLPDTFKKDLDEAAKILLETNEGDLRSALNRSKEMSASGIKDYFSGLTDRRKAALLFLIAQNAATQRETATDPKQIAALKDIEAEAIADFTDMMSQGGKLLNIAGQLYAAMPMSPDAQVMAAEKLLARMTGGRAAEVEAEQAKDTLKTALDEQLKGMDESIRKIMQTKPKASWDEIRQRIADEVVAKMNLATDAERKTATDKIIADLKKRMEKVRKELLAKMSKPGKPGNKIALEKLWKLWELGALDDDAFTKVFMEKAGVQEFTPAFRDKLKKMYEDAEAAPEGMPRDRVLGNVAVEIALANPKTFSFWWNLAMSISYGNILGAFTTIFVNNPLGSLATSLEMVAMGSLSNKGARAETFKGAVKTWARSFGEGVAMMRDLWSTGENLQKISQFDSALVNSPVELLAKMAEDPSYPKSFRVAAKAVSQYKWVMRSMMAADAVIRWPAREALRFTQSAAIAKDTRRPGQSLEDAVDELNYPGGRLAALKESRAQAAQELKDGTLKTKQDERLRVIDLLQIKLSAQGTETATESDALANYGSLLNDQPQDFIGVIASAILKTAFPSNTKSDLQKALGGALQPFVRFVRTSANATRVMLDYSVGYGAFRYMTRKWPVIGAESLAGGVNLIQPGGRDKMSENAAIRAGDKLTQVRIQRAYLGMALYAGLAAIYAAIDDDDEDPYIDFIGSGPTTPDERRRVRESGVRLNSIKIGDIYVPTNVGPLQPLAGILGPFQRMRDNKKYPKAKDEFDERVPETAGVAIAKGIADAMSNQSFTRSLADLLTMINTGKTSFGETPDEFLGKTLAQFVPGNLRGLSQLDEIVRGKKERADGFFDTATNSIAFYAPNGRATTILGDEVDAGKSIAQKAGEKVFQFTTIADDKTLQFVVKNGLSIPDRQRKPSDGKRQTYLEYSAYVRESGKMMRNWLETENPKTGKTGMEMLQAIPDKITVEKGKTVNLRKKEMNKLWVDFREVALAKQ